MAAKPDLSAKAANRKIVSASANSSARWKNSPRSSKNQVITAAEWLEADEDDSGESERHMEHHLRR